MSGPNGEKCGDCYFWGEWEDRDRDFGANECKRWPHQVNLPFKDTYLEYMGPDELHEVPSLYDYRQPLVQKNDWCGEFKPREESS